MDLKKAKAYSGKKNGSNGSIVFGATRIIAGVLIGIFTYNAFTRSNSPSSLYPGLFYVIIGIAVLLIVLGIVDIARALKQ